MTVWLYNADWLDVSVDGKRAFRLKVRSFKTKRSDPSMFADDAVLEMSYSEFESRCSFSFSKFIYELRCNIVSTLKFTQSRAAKDQTGVHSEPHEKDNSRPNPILLSIFLPSRVSEDVIANFEDLFDVWKDRYGASKARWLYRVQAVGTIVSHWFVPLRKLLAWLAGFIGFKLILELFKG